MKVWYEAGVWGDDLSRCELLLEIKLSQSNGKLGPAGGFFLLLWTVSLSVRGDELLKGCLLFVVRKVLIQGVQ